MAQHPIVHMDIPAADTAAAAQFYADVFGWPLGHDEQYDYWWFRGEGGPGGGFVKPDAPSGGTAPPYKLGEVRVYIGTDDIDASLAEIEAHGGKSLGPKVDMGGQGGYAFFADPAGNIIGLYTAPAAGS